MSRAKLSFPDAKSLHAIFETVSKLVDEVSIIVANDGFKIVALDDARVALLKVNLPPEIFLEYSIENDYATMGFGLERVVKILSRGKKGERLDIDISEEEVTWTIYSSAIKKFTIRNLEVPQPEIPEGEIELANRIAMIVEPFRDALKDAESIGEIVELDASSEDVFVIRGVGESLAETKLPRDAPSLIEYEVKEPGKSAYSIEYLKHVISLTKVADTIVIEFSPQMPLRLMFKLPGGGDVEYLLAPRP